MKIEKDNIFFTIYIILGLICSVISWLTIILVNLNMLQINGFFYTIAFLGSIFVTAMTLTNINMLIDMKKLEKRVKKQMEESRKRTIEKTLDEIKKEDIRKFLFIMNEIKNRKIQ